MEAPRDLSHQQHEPNTLPHRLPTLVIAFLLVANHPSAGEEEAAASIDFERDVLPLLTRRCFSCHGPEKAKGGLRLHARPDALLGGDSGAVIKPGRSRESRLITLVAGLDEEIVMPPRGERLTGAEVALLATWIDAGAPWPETAATEVRGVAGGHWAFEPRRPVALPPTRRGTAGEPIDRFVLARLDAAGVAPSAEADRSTLLRRLSLDLHGILPTADETAAFLEDDRPDAYERLVDRLLASPHFGERWGRHWLDLARYADSDGYEKDQPRPYAWRYRNWVIEAINRDLPFDRFSTEQLAGDLLPDATLEQKVATGFHRNTLTNREGGVDQEEYRVKAVVDRVNTTGSVWLGLTVGCAQCHSHKYDPLTQREYYGLFAFFDSADEVDVSAPTAEERRAHEKARRRFVAERREKERALTAYESLRAEKQRAWERDLRDALREGPVEWQPLDAVSFTSEAGAASNRLADASLLVTGHSAEKDTYSIVARTRLPRMTAVRLEALAEAGLPGRGPGSASNGNFVLSEIEVSVAPDGCATQARVVRLVGAAADFSQPGWSVDGAIDGKLDTGWAIAGKEKETLPRSAVFEFESGVDLEPGGLLVLTLKQAHGKRHTLGRFRLSATAAAPELLHVPPDVLKIVAIPGAERSAEQEARLADHHRKVDPEYVRLEKAIADHDGGAPAPPPTRAQAIAERPEPRVTHLMVRGDFLRPGAQVLPHTPAILPPLTASGRPNRLDLARWLTSADNPLTARVAVNRIWQHLFGAGLVVTADDFGTRGEEPSHPALLDWLASEFIRLGWSRKAMIRRLVLSSTYRQASRIRTDLVDSDPKNRLLARQNRFRCEAEVVRDLALAASGLLSRAIGGPPVRPPLPADVAALGYANSVKWKESSGADRFRRGLYIFFQRTVPYPMLMTFDAPDSNVTCTRRARSNTPLQALTLLNDPVFFECAQRLGRDLATADGDVDERIRQAVRRCLARETTAAEVARLREAYVDLLRQCRAEPRVAEEMLGDHRSSVKDAPAAAAWVALARILLNLDEFVTRE